MANIMFNNYCNLHCSYCFADNIIQEEKFSITEEELKHILNYLNFPNTRIGIIGGEPTLHPNFEKLFNICLQHSQIYNQQITLFTNGSMLDKYYHLLEHDNVSALINVNNDCIELYNKLIDNLDLCYSKKIALGVNISPDRLNYDFIWDIVKKFNVKELRFAVVTPGGSLCHYKDNKENYYQIMKPIFLDFCKEAIQNNCQLCADCAQIPNCYFSEEELSIVYQACPLFDQPHCGFVCDIQPNGESSWCFGSQITDNLFNYNDIDDFSDGIYQKFIQKVKELDRQEKCYNCDKYDQCKGGCLGFAS